MKLFQKRIGVHYTWVSAKTATTPFRAEAKQKQQCNYYTALEHRECPGIAEMVTQYVLDRNGRRRYEHAQLIYKAWEGASRYPRTD